MDNVMYLTGIYGKGVYNMHNNPPPPSEQIRQAVTDYLHYTWIFGEAERDKAGEIAGRDGGTEYPLDEQERP